MIYWQYPDFSLWFTDIILTSVNIKPTGNVYLTMQVVYFTNSGGEANELAMLMARLYTGSFDIVTLR